MKWLELPINLMMWLGCFFGFLMMMHVTIDVTGRVLFNHPLDGTIEIVSGYYMVAVSFLPLAWVSHNQGQIIVELFTRNWTGRKLLGLETVTNFLTFIYMSLFTWQTTLAAIEETEAGSVWETADGFMAIWPSRWMLPLAGLLMAIYFIARIFHDLRQSEPK